MLWDHVPLDAVQSSLPDPANQFLVRPAPNATAPPAAADAGNTRAVGGGRRGIRTDQDVGGLIGTGAWGRGEEDDFRLTEDRFDALPCRGRCPEGVYPARPEPVADA